VAALGIDRCRDVSHGLDAVGRVSDGDDFRAEQTVEEGVTRGRIRRRPLGDENATQTVTSGEGGGHPAVIRLRSAGRDEARHSLNAVRCKYELEFPHLVAAQGETRFGVHLYYEVAHAKLGSEAVGPEQGRWQIRELRSGPPLEELDRLGVTHDGTKWSQ